MVKTSIQDIVGDVKPEKPPEKTARDRTIEFIKIPDNSDYEFVVDTILHDPHRFVHNMRVVLSKLRGIVKRKGAEVKPFKMKLVSVEKIDARFSKVMLRKSMDEIVEEVSDLIDELTLGKKEEKQ